MHIAGVQVARGYLGQPELTAERFVADPFAAGAGERMYRTGDLAYWRWDGAIQFLGRLDHQVKVRGFRIELGEIEVRLREMEEVADCVVTAWGAEDGDQRLAAYLVFEAGCSLGMVELRRRLSETLPDYMVPGWVVPLEALPLTSSGKVDRKALPDPLEGSLPTERGYEAPVGEVEETIAGVIRPILQKDGGDIELIDIDGRNVQVALRGQCVNCQVSDVTLKNLVEAKLREFVEEEIVVHEVK